MKKLIITLGLSALLSSTGCFFFSGPSAHWKLDDGQGTTAYDSSNGNDGTIIGNAQWINGKIGDYALKFDGSGYIDISPVNDIFNSEIFTLSLWISNNNGNKTSAFFRRTGGWHFRISNSELQFVIEGGSTVNTGYYFPDNQWHHYTMIVNNSEKTFKLFVDGEQYGESQNYDDGFVQSDSAVYIGQFSSGYRWRGNLDDIRFYQEELCPFKIQDLYKMGEEKIFTPAPVIDPEKGIYNDEIDVTISSPDAGAAVHYTTDGSDPTPQSALYLGPIHLSGIGTTTVKAIAVKADQEDSYIAVSRYTMAGDEILLAHWRLDEGSDVMINDSTIFGNNGHLITGLEKWITGIIGDYALDFDGINDYIEIPNQENEIFNSKTFTAAAWLYSGNGTTTCAYMRRVDGWHIRTSNGEWDFIIEGGSTVKSGYYFPYNEWHHYAVTVDNINRTVSFYVDGNLVNGPVSYSAGFFDSDGDVYIGQFSSSFRWSGHIDDVKFFNKVLNAAEIQEVFLSN